MPVRPSSRVDVVIVPSEPDRDVPGDDAVAALVDAGLLSADGGPGPRASELVAGGFVRWRLERNDRAVLWANQQGGFRVRCPVTSELVVPAFEQAFRAWRGGGPRELACPCGRTHPLEALVYEPDAAWARVALVLADAGGVTLGSEGAAAFRGYWGDVRAIARRVG